jgi:hypothetical protein
MSDELQADSGMVIDFGEDEVLQDQPQEPEQESANVESATTETDDDRAVDLTEEQQHAFNKRVAREVYKRKELEREKERLAKQVAELQAKIPTNTRPEVPPIPDPYTLTEEQYRQAQQARDKALSDAIAFDARQAQYNEQARQIKAQQEQQQQRETEEKVKSYSQQATKLGVKPEELQHAASIVQTFGLDGYHPLASLILADETGPLITKYLANNVLELERVMSMPLPNAAVYLATAVKQKAAALKPKVNTAPDPIDSPRSTGTGQKSRGPKGATFE